jgi:hypothetical protein
VKQGSEPPEDRLGMVGILAKDVERHDYGRRVVVGGVGGADQHARRLLVLLGGGEGQDLLERLRGIDAEVLLRFDELEQRGHRAGRLQSAEGADGLVSRLVVSGFETTQIPLDENRVAHRPRGDAGDQEADRDRHRRDPSTLSTLHQATALERGDSSLVALF